MPRATRRKYKPRKEEEKQAMLVRIREGRAKGVSFERIAREMRTTKNIVLALYHRNKADTDHDIEARIEETRDAVFGLKFNNRKNVVTLPKLPAKPMRLWKSTPPSKKHQLLMETGKPGTCMWLDGEASLRNFCGQPAHKGAWCAAHRRRVYLPWKPSVSQVSSSSRSLARTR